MGVIETFYIPKGSGRYPIYFANGAKTCIDVPEYLGILAVTIEYTPAESLHASLPKRYKRA